MKTVTSIILFIAAGAHRTRAAAPNGSSGICLIRMEAAGRRHVGRVFLP